MSFGFLFALTIQGDANIDPPLLMATILRMGLSSSLAVTIPLCLLRGASHSTQ